MTQMRLQTVRRIVEVQRQLHRAAEWKLGELRQQEADLAQAQQEVIGALNGDASLHGRFVHAMARQLGRLAAQSDAVTESRDRQAEVLREQTGRLKQAERMQQALGREEARAGERESLDALADLLAGRPAASLP